MFSSILPGRREKGQYGGQPGMAESGYGPGYGQGYGGQQYGMQGQPDGHGQANGYVGDGGVAQPPPAQAPPAYGTRP